jgi:uncharacterized repeat protein (TIGR03843 family)
MVLHAHDRFGEPAVLAHADHPGVKMMAAMDVVVNNADRKGGHVLHGTDGHVYGVDHGICLHTENKLRTVLWGFLGTQLPADAVESLQRLRSALDGEEFPDVLNEHITLREVAALRSRTRRLLKTLEYPEPGGEWRAIPWPAF